MGNIENPTVEKWMTKDKATPFSAQIVIWILYLVWFFNQFIMGIVLLNFLIA